MKTLNQQMAPYAAAHRNRTHGSEDGSVRVCPRSKVKKWQGIYHVTKQRKDGTTGRNTMYRIIGLCAKMTKREAEVEHRNWCKEFHQSPLATKTSGKHLPTVADIAADYLSFKRGDWSAGTNAVMTSAVNCGIVPALGHLTLKEATSEILRAYVHSLPHRVHVRPGNYPAKTGCSPSYVEQTITNLRGMFALAVVRKLIAANPASCPIIRLSKPKGIVPTDKTIFPPEQLPALLSQLRHRDSLIVWISLLGGTRPNELFAIHGDDIGDGFVAIRHALDGSRNIKTTKTDKPRIVALPPKVNARLQEWVRENGVGPDDLLFRNRKGMPLDRGNILRRLIRPAAERAGIATADVDFQMLRRSFATIASALGFDVKSIQTQLGHSKPNMSYGEYVQPVDAVRQAHMIKLENVCMGLETMTYDVTKRLGSERIQ